MIGEPDKELPQPKEPQAPALNGRAEVENFQFDVRAQVRTYLKGLTLNGYPIDFEGNNMRVSAAAMIHNRDVTREEPTRREAPVVIPTMRIVAPATVARVQPQVVPPRPPAPSRQTAPTAPQRNSETIWYQDRGILNQDLRSNPRQGGPNQTRRISNKTDTTMLARTATPVLLTRGDSSTQILAFLDTPYAGEIDPDNPPAPADYYTAVNVPTNHYSFEIVAETSDPYTPQVKIFDGLVNDELPSGMGGDDYILTAYDGVEYWIGITYNTTTFEITSRYLATDEPATEFGSLGILLGGATVTYNNDGSTTVKPYNAWSGGDIRVALRYVTVNGALGVEPFCTFAEPTEVPTG